MGPRPTLFRAAAVCALAALVAVGCSTRRPAPVSDRTVTPRSTAAPKAPVATPPAPAATPGYYTVRPGDTLYSIALDHGLDYRELAAWNGITQPGAIRAGQQLRMTAPQPAVTTTAPLRSPPGVEGRPIAPGAVPGTVQGSSGAVKSQPQAVRVPYSDEAYAQLASVRPPAVTPAKPEAPSTAAPAGDDGIQFTWPASGRIVNSFSDAANLKGIGIAGKAGQPVYASAPGRVIFSGTGIRGFGKLIVIKHNNTFLSVYGHNHELLVKEGQNVAKGQKIAEMGSTDTDRVKLHFEIRRFGKPVDPVKLLPPV